MGLSYRSCAGKRRGSSYREAASGGEAVSPGRTPGHDHAGRPLRAKTPAADDAAPTRRRNIELPSGRTRTRFGEIENVVRHPRQQVDRAEIIEDLNPANQRALRPGLIGDRAHQVPGLTSCCRPTSTRNVSISSVPTRRTLAGKPLVIPTIAEPLAPRLAPSGPHGRPAQSGAGPWSSNRASRRSANPPIGGNSSVSRSGPRPMKSLRGAARDLLDGRLGMLAAVLLDQRLDRPGFGMGQSGAVIRSWNFETRRRLISASSRTSIGSISRRVAFSSRRSEAAPSDAGTGWRSRSARRSVRPMR